MIGTVERKRAVLLMVVCAVMWSTGGIFIKLVPWNALAIAGCRSLIAGMVVLAYIKYNRMKVKVCKSSLVSGAFMSGIFIFFVMANKLTTAANAIVLQFTSPVFILIISALFFHRKTRKGDLITVLVTLLGISMFFFDQLTPGGMTGNCFAILAGLMMACGFLAVGEVDEETRMSGILFGQMFTAVIGVPFLSVGTNPATPTAVLCMLALGIFQLGIPYVLFGLSMKHCTALACNLIGAIEPVLNPVWVFLFDGEAPGMYALIGGAVVVAAVSAWCIYDSKGGKITEAQEAA